MKKIFKYPIQLSGNLRSIQMPRRAKILSFQDQHGTLCIWALVDTNEMETTRHFILFGTGHRVICDYELKFVGTAQQGAFLWHLFEALSE